MNLFGISIVWTSIYNSWLEDCLFWKQKAQAELEIIEDLEEYIDELEGKDTIKFTGEVHPLFMDFEDGSSVFNVSW